MKNISDNFWMDLAFKEAQKAFSNNEVPVGAVLVQNEEIISKNYNQRESRNDFLAHAEILVLQEAQQKLNNWRLPHTTLYVTTEPCPMCLGALLHTRIERLVFGCSDPKRDDQNFFPSLINQNFIKGNNHQLEITNGILEEECRDILKKFFIERR